jgi:hypothetical protein
MPTQSIDFGNVGAANFNGTSLDAINLNGSGIWTGAFSNTITGDHYRQTPKNKPRRTFFLYRHYAELQTASEYATKSSSTVGHSAHFKDHYFVNEIQYQYNPALGNGGGAAFTRVTINIGYNQTYTANTGSPVQQLFMDYNSGAIEIPWTKTKLISPTYPGGELVLNWPRRANWVSYTTALDRFAHLTPPYIVNGPDPSESYGQAHETNGIFYPSSGNQISFMTVQWQLPIAQFNPSHFGGYEPNPSGYHTLTVEIS